jgi:hypothetical protein
VLVALVDADDFTLAGDLERTIRARVVEQHLEVDGRAQTKLGRENRERSVDAGYADILGAADGPVEYHWKPDSNTQLLPSIGVRERFVRLHRQTLEKAGQAHHPTADTFFSNRTFYGDLRGPPRLAPCALRLSLDRRSSDVAGQ